MYIGPPYAYALQSTPAYACLSRACVIIDTGHSAQYVLDIRPPYAYALQHISICLPIPCICIAMATGHMHSAQYLLDIGPPYSYALQCTPAYARGEEVVNFVCTEST